MSSAKAYDYDARGNTTVRPGQTLNWNPQGRLEKLSGPTGDTNYVYDAEGALLVRRSPTETTLFLGELELTLNKATRKVLGKRQYSFAGQTIGVRSANGTATSDMSWLVADYHGTSQVAVDAATQVATKRYAKPFGDPRGTAAPAWPDNHGFLNKPEDKNTGLTTVGAREYDPTIGRFISVDPLLDAGDPQQMLGYTYANDNPVSGSDPTGLLNADDGTGGGTPDVPRGAWTPDPFAGGNDNQGNDGGTNNKDDNHKSSGWSKFKGWTKKRVNDVTDKVDEAHQWAKDHASEVGATIAVSVAVVGVAAFCAGTAGLGCVIVAGAVMASSGASLGYGARIALDDQESFSTADYATEVVTSGAAAAAGSALGIGAGAVAGAVAARGAGAAGKSLLGKTTGQAANTAPEVISGTNARGLVNSRGSFRKATLQDAWDGASAGPSGGRLCPTCGGEVSVPPHTGVPRDWDGSHFPSWTNREFPSTITRGKVLDNYNQGVSLECPICNRLAGNNDARFKK